ncbi:hypothetical protein O181_022684 [Austropuccinia psidii MF-1]|uniref:Uncharacterized protein n=1 Tax=Austropuccinia psidii MF-1 TaxID=1389203 RepID=A0A9Q3CD24_9BASI|nr:hypothetical protein [Austropuccinia psidii MF-1]
MEKGRKLEGQGSNLGEGLAFKLGWTMETKDGNCPSTSLPEGVKDKGLVSFMLNDYPWDLPENVEHWMMISRKELVTADSFKLRPGEKGEVPANFQDDEKVKDLALYLENFDIFGQNFLDESALAKIDVGGFSHQGKPHVTETNYAVSQAEGMEAMRWAGRSVAELIEEEFPAKEYEALWTQSPVRLR